MNQKVQTIAQALREVLDQGLKSFTLHHKVSKYDSLNINTLSKGMPSLTFVFDGTLNLSFKGNVQSFEAGTAVVLGQGNIGFVENREHQSLIIKYETDDIFIEYFDFKQSTALSFQHHQSVVYKDLMKVISQITLKSKFTEVDERVLYGSFYFLSLIDSLLNDKSWLQGKIQYSLKRHRFREIQMYALDNISGDLRRETLCKKFGLNVKTFTELFTYWEGITYQQYIIELRLNEARNYLLTHEVSIEELAEKYGFNSTDHFIYTFKKNYGYPPFKLKKLLTGRQNNIHSLRDLNQQKGYNYVEEVPEKNIKPSKETGIPTVAYFINESGNDLELFWIDEEGLKVILGILHPHKRLRCNIQRGYTFVGVAGGKSTYFSANKDFPLGLFT